MQQRIKQSADKSPSRIPSSLPAIVYALGLSTLEAQGELSLCLRDISSYNPAEVLDLEPSTINSVR